MENKQTFSYPEPYKTYGMINSILIIILFCYVFISESKKLSLSIMENGASAQDIFGYVVIMLLLPLVATTIINYYQEFTVADDGIEFQSFYFWRIFIPWSEIITMKKTFMAWNYSHTVIVNKLTFLHRVIGSLYGLSLKPGFVFYKQLSNYDEAVELIQENLISLSTDAVLE